MKYLRILYITCISLLGLISIFATTKPTPIKPHESFMLAYVDTSNNIQVRYSDDGSTWSTGIVPSGVSSHGVGASGSNDNVAATRLLAYTDSAGNLKLKFGLGPANWDSSSLTYNSIHPGQRPTIIDIGNSKYVIAYTHNNEVKVARYDHTARQITDITPALSGLPRNLVLGAPAMTFRDGKIVISWLRYTSTNNSAKPQEIRIGVASVDNSGNVSWTNGFNFNAPNNSPSNYYGNGLVSEPSLTRDRSRFYLGAVHASGYQQQPDTCPQHQLLSYRIWWSYDGISWYSYRTADYYNNAHLLQAVRTDNSGVCVKPRVLSSIEIAQTCKGVITTLAITGGQAARPYSIYRLFPPNVSFIEINTNAVFGSAAAAARRFSLLSVGKAENIYIPGVPGNHCWN